MFADGNLCYLLVLVIVRSTIFIMSAEYAIYTDSAACMVLLLICAMCICCACSHNDHNIFFKNIDSNVEVSSLHSVKSLGEIVWNFDKLQVEILTMVATP